VTQHFVRYSTKYSYSKLSSLGFVSVYDQLFEGFPSDDEKVNPQPSTLNPQPSTLNPKP
jgi:hypothetical protein